jgi:hypothetical protein
MLALGSVVKTDIGMLEADGERYRVTLHIAHDGIEYVGRLWFTDIEWDDSGFLDRGVLPGRSETEVLDLALRLTDEELAMRFRRGNAEKRRYHGLRRLTTEMLEKIRYMNRVAVSLRKGLLDVQSARQEIDLTEKQMLQLIVQARNVAGIEG